MAVYDSKQIFELMFPGLLSLVVFVGIAFIILFVLIFYFYFSFA